MLDVKVRDFQAIKSADIAVEGITIIVGANDVGKTAMSRAIRSTLLNSSNDDMVRWGQSEFEVSIDVDGDNIVYGRSKARSGSGVRVSYNGNSKTKVGREKLCDLFPDFPFQIKDVSGNVFFPHHVFQFELPVFSQVDVYEFFSSMFEKIDLMTQLSVSQKKLLADSRKAVDSKVSVLDSWDVSLVEVQDGLSVFDIPAVQKCSSDYKEISSIQSVLDADMIEYDKLSVQLESLSAIDSVVGSVDLDSLVSVFDLIGQYDVVSADLMSMDSVIKSKSLYKKSIGYRLAIVGSVLDSQKVLGLIDSVESVDKSLIENSDRRGELISRRFDIKEMVLLVEAGLLVEDALQVAMRVDYLDSLISGAIKNRDSCKVDLAKIDVCPLCNRKF